MISVFVADHVCWVVCSHKVKEQHAWSWYVTPQDHQGLATAEISIQITVKKVNKSVKHLFMSLGLQIWETFSTIWVVKLYKMFWLYPSELTPMTYSTMTDNQWPTKVSSAQANGSRWSDNVVALIVWNSLDTKILKLVSVNLNHVQSLNRSSS